MRPTFARRILAPALVLGAALVANSPRIQADPPPAWERPIQQGIADQDAEVARGSAKAAATRLESQSSRNRKDFIVHYLLARAYGLDKRLADAITAYGEAIALEPGCWYAWRDRGVLRLLSKDVNGAEQDFRQAIALNYRFLPALQPLGVLLIESKRYKEGIEILTKALNVDPHLDSARLQIADAFLAMGVPDNALRTLDPLIAKAPKNPLLRVAQARYLLAKSDFPGAQKVYKQMALDNPNDPGPLNAWLSVAIRAKTLDPDEGVWVLEQLRRLARTADERTKITKEIEELRRQAAGLTSPAAPKGPPTPEDLIRLLRSSEPKAREWAAYYILTGVKEHFTISPELAVALIERTKPAKAPDVPAKGEDLPRIRSFALEILSRYGTPEFASIIRTSLRDEDANVRRWAATALGRLKNHLAIAALWRYATGPDHDLAVSARLAIYELAEKAPPEADLTPEAQAAAFHAWWTSAEARDVKLRAIAAVLASADRAVDELLFPLAYLDADEVVAMAAYQGLRSLAKIATDAIAEAKKGGKPVPAGVTWMASLPDLGQAPIVTSDPAGHATPPALPDPTAPDSKPHKNSALGSWWLRRPAS